MASRVAPVSITSSKPPLLRAWAFLAGDEGGLDGADSIRDRAKAFSASIVVRPVAARMTASRISGGGGAMRRWRGDGRAIHRAGRDRQSQVEAGELALQLRWQGFQTPRSRRSFPPALAWRRVSRSLRTRTGRDPSSRAAKSRRSTRQSPSIASTASRRRADRGRCARCRCSCRRSRW